MKKEIDIVGLGASTLDFLSIVDHFPIGEEVQKAYCSKFEGGGPIATAMVAASRLGAKTMMLDSIGADWIGKMIIEGFEKEGVGTDYIKINSGCSSSIPNVFVRKGDGARTIIYSPGTTPELTEKDIVPSVISGAKFLHVNGRHYEACLSACKFAKRSGTKISFDGGSHRFREELRNIVPLTDICIVTKDFSIAYTKETDMIISAEVILNNGPSTVVITDGENGSWLFNEDIKAYHQKAFIMDEVVDTTGCGDCFHGAFLFALSSGYDLKETIKIASAAAALNTRHLGGRSALPDYNELISFLKKVS